MAKSLTPDRSAAQDDDAIDPGLRGTPEMNFDMPDAPPEGFNAAGLTTPLFDDVDDPFPGPQSSTGTPASIPASDDGIFIPEPTNRERMLQAQAKFAEVMRSRISKSKSTVANANSSEAPAPAPADAWEMTVTVAEPDVMSKKKDAAALTFAKVKAAYERKKRAGTLNMEGEVAYMKAEAAEQGRLRKRQADEEYDRESLEEEAAGIPEDASDHFVPLEVPGAADEESDAAETPVKRRSKKSADDGGPTRKKGRKTAEPKTAAKIDGRKRKAPGAKAKRKNEPAMANLGSIMGTDVFGDTAATAGLRNQPTSFGAAIPGHRDKALAQLIASVPASDQKVAGADKRLLNAAIRDFTGQASVKPSDNGDGSWLVSGMKSTLKHYQVLGTAFMRRREGAPQQPKGGILADEMGLGKTVMMLANIVNGKPKKQSKYRATLIVASRALITQWAHEIEKHTLSNREHKSHGLRWVRNHAGHRLSTNDNIAEMEQYDVVLTTYTEVLKSYPSRDIPPELVTAKQKADWWAETFENEKGDLHHVHWFRVVLDEAQAIKNHLSTTSKACRALESTHNWAITGTPIQNTIAEFYPYFKFIKEPTTGSYRIFKENFVTPSDDTGMHRLQTYLNKFMVRRTHLDTLFNARLLDLPTPTEQTFWVEFNDVERQIYEIVKKRFIERINTIAKQGGLEKQYHHIWTLILRLRQICGHLLLVQVAVCDLLKREDFEKLNAINSNQEEGSDEGANLLLHLRHVLKHNVGVKAVQGGMQGAVVSEGETVPMDLINAAGAEESTGGKHGEAFHFKKYLTSLSKSGKWDIIKEKTRCIGCKQPPYEPFITSCWHIYCYSCIEDLQNYAAGRGKDGARCSECGEEYTSCRPCEGLDAFDGEGSASESLADPVPGKGSGSGSGNAKAKGKGKKRAKESEMEDWISLKGEVLPSAKTAATKAQVLNWLADDPEGKIIIFTQFLPMVEILAKICKTEGWSFCKYTGEMNHDAREKAIREFAEQKQIMLASLRSGGLGLNLTMASRVICLDPWWNNSVEQQAFCRVFRIGQTKPTIFMKFVVRNTIDAAMVDMKERKQIEIDEAMSDSRKRDMSVKDLLKLFGPVEEDDEGHPFIFAEGNEHDEEEEHLRVPNLDKEDEGQAMGDEA
ncbi:hypothetical protein B0A55_00717 [Friedmanniomyces simplex]|uniref:RING-type domain-containing protein n=1 Tax=Friedmanniomyces simplex TaxID=329884 RepID=A0A4U0Y1C4_9PEZI|nr:hypothetical protein B0A55_00717 [Friedmanniomyces simplex]